MDLLVGDLCSVKFRIASTRLAIEVSIESRRDSVGRCSEEVVEVVELLEDAADELRTLARMERSDVTSFPCSIISVQR